VVLYNKGKNKFVKTLINNPAHGTTLKAMKSSVCDAETIEQSAEQYLVALYGDSRSEESHNAERYKHYIKFS
jgi:hypothetical protein